MGLCLSDLILNSSGNFIGSGTCSVPNSQGQVFPTQFAVHLEPIHPHQSAPDLQMCLLLGTVSSGK